VALYRASEYGHSRLKGRKILAIALVVVIAAALSGVSFWHHKPQTAPVAATHQNRESVTHPATARDAPTEVSGKYLFSGTVVLARDVERYAAGNYSQPFSGMSTLGTYDAHIGVLECPVTNNPDSFENEVQNLIFNCKPAWVSTLKNYFPILNLSSDHLNDQSSQGIANTFKVLQQTGIQTVGTYDPSSLSDDCKAVILPVRVQSSSGKTTSASMPVAMCSYNYKWLFSPKPGQLESIKKWSKVMPVIALFNHGPEYQLTADSQTTAIAHKMIDYGADFVIGNGTHWAGNTEVYKGKLIVYSMGNFIFDQLDYKGRIALNLSVTMTIAYNQNVAKWMGSSDRCMAQAEACLTMAQQEQLAKITPQYRFDVVGSYGGDGRVATKANAQQQADIEKIANWPATQQQLGE